MISIICANWNAYDFTGLLIESLNLFSEVPYKLLVVDNSESKQSIDRPNVHQFFMHRNIGHGPALNFGAMKSAELFPENPFLMFLDSDCHFFKHGWEAAFISKMRDFDIIGGKGPTSKPIRPACIFMRKELGRHDWAATPGYQGNRVTPSGYDVAIKAYYQIMQKNYRIGFLSSHENHYGTLNGEEFGIDGEPYVYHHWHGSHLVERQSDFPEHDLQEDKKKLFDCIPWRLV